MARSGTISPARLSRLKQLNHIFATGGYTTTELANRFGVSVPMIIHDRKWIVENWWRAEASQETLDKRMQSVENMKMLRRLHLESYHRSRHDEEEITTRFVDKPCPECGGEKTLRPGVKCLECEGTGITTEEVVTRKVKGQAGDAAHLQGALKCTVEICKLEGLYPAEVKQLKVTGVVEHDHVVSVEDKYADADPEDILAAKVALARLEQSARQRTIEGKVLNEEAEE